MIRLLHLNDTEGTAQTLWARLVSAIQAQRALGQATLLLHAGDIPLEVASAPRLLPLLQSLRFDAIALGNHDFGENSLPMLAEGSLPFVCANLSHPDWKALRPYRLVHLVGWSIALLGMTLLDLRRYVPARFLKNCTVSDPFSAMSALIEQLRPRVDMLAIVSHAGMAVDIELAQRIAGIDVIFGGHDHAQFSEPMMVGTTMIVQAEPHGNSLGVLSLSRYERIWHNIPVMQYPLDHDVLEQLSALPTQHSRILGYTQTDMRSVHAYSATALNCLVVDLLRAYAHADLALLRCASIENTIPAGPITEHDIQNCVHCGADQIAILSCSGAELWQTLEQGAREEYYLLTIAGASVIYDLHQKPGRRVQAVEVDGTPLDLEAVYSVACSEVLAKGVGDFEIFRNKPHKTLAYTIHELLFDHLQTQHTIAPKSDGRLLFLESV